ncbi:hypothetical protein [Afifella aestuarii]|uniref:hypothetical protein n=1 Tax=Afifella aestuarii TaxID=1909496 RepID=UPI000FE2C833|nr:hypothetical protein [Afifella aestuarii]
MPWFIIVNGEVTQKFTSLPQLAPGINAEEVSQSVFDEVSTGYVQDGLGGYRERRWYDEYDNVDQMKLGAANEWKKDSAEGLMSIFYSDYPANEIAAFAQSRLAAEAYLADLPELDDIGAAQKALIENEATARGKTPTEVCNSIITKNDEYQKAIGRLKGFRANVDLIVDDFARDIGESEPAAKDRLWGLLEAEYNSAETAIDLIVT